MTVSKLESKETDSFMADIHGAVQSTQKTQKSDIQDTQDTEDTQVVESSQCVVPEKKPKYGEDSSKSVLNEAFYVFSSDSES